MIRLLEHISNIFDFLINPLTVRTLNVYATKDFPGFFLAVSFAKPAWALRQSENKRANQDPQE